MSIRINDIYNQIKQDHLSLSQHEDSLFKKEPNEINEYLKKVIGLQSCFSLTSLTSLDEIIKDYINQIMEIENQKREGYSEYSTDELRKILNDWHSRNLVLANESNFLLNQLNQDGKLKEEKCLLSLFNKQKKHNSELMDCITNIYNSYATFTKNIPPKEGGQMSLKDTIEAFQSMVGGGSNG